MRQSSFTFVPRYGSRGAHQLQFDTFQSEWNHVPSLLKYQALRISKQVPVTAQCVAVSRETLYKPTGGCGLGLAWLLPCAETGIGNSLSGTLVKVYTTCSYIVKSTLGPHSVFMCFVWIWEQTAIISLYSINWLVFITETECIYCAVRTGSLYIILRSAHTVYLCVLCGSENKQRLFPYTALTDWFL
jgi:hypothetical protein